MSDKSLQHIHTLKKHLLLFPKYLSLAELAHIHLGIYDERVKREAVCKQ